MVVTQKVIKIIQLISYEHVIANLEMLTKEQCYICIKANALGFLLKREGRTSIQLSSLDQSQVK